MNTYRADLHIHSVLSPCGDLDMSPGNIVDRAVQKGIEIISVTDHNHTGHAKLTRRLGEARGIWVVYGVELTTKEEVHCLAYFDTDEQLDQLQVAVNSHLPKISNETAIFGHQVLVDEKEKILSEVTHSLYPGINLDISELATMVHRLGGIFVPAHVDRQMNGLYAQLGFFPDELEADAVEISWRTDTQSMLEEHAELSRFQLLRSSDAHYIEDIGRVESRLLMNECSFVEFCMALRGEEGRKVLGS